MSLPIEVTIPWISGLSVDQMLITTERGGHYTQGYRQAKAHVADHMMVGASGHRPTEEPVWVQLKCYFPDRQRRDLDNLTKPFLDGLQEWVIEDDSQVHRLTVERGGVDRDEPRVEVKVRPYNDASETVSGK